MKDPAGGVCEEEAEEEGGERKTGVPAAAAAVRGEDEPLAASGHGRYREAGALYPGVGRRRGAGRGEGVCQGGVRSLLPATQILPAGGEGVCREGGEASISARSFFIPGLFPLLSGFTCTFLTISLQFFMWHWRLFLLLETLWGWGREWGAGGVRCCNLRRSGRFSGTGRDLAVPPAPGRS